ncbi:hypothetical protein ACJMK2_028917 [Sinanodonta woodiana]|uniref:RING-type domain-containing protein n=1 Tax=Sinanodonta woodiana TaxID=1069815 RepID=A0ABD3X8K8_SINWO
MFSSISLGSTQTKNMAAQPDQLGIHLGKPKFLQYAVLSKRKESFTKWPKYIQVQPEQLAEAGFFYTGVGDSVKCYYCGGGLQFWEPTDEPWVEHAVWYPSCPHISLNKGAMFVNEIQAREKGGISSISSRTTDTAEAKAQDPMESLAVAALLDFGVEEKLVHQAVDYMKTKHKSIDFNTVKARDLMEIVSNIEEDMERIKTKDERITQNAPVPKIDKVTIENLDIIQRETQRLKEESTCIICLELLACVIFLPCGHRITCGQCAPALYKCPLCRKDINGTVKASFSV